MQTLLKSTQAYKLLHTETRAERSSHAYLLVMEDGENLREACKVFAKVFFGCDMEESGGYQSFSLFSDKERISKLIDAESFSDCLFYPEDGKKPVVDDAEKIREECSLTPVEGNRKVFVVCDFAEANPQTQNKLLKLLEEPPQGVIFLLGATSVFPVLPTVLSRAKRLEILPFSIEETTKCLSRIYGQKYEREILALCAAAANGIVGDAQNILEGGQYKTTLDGAFDLCLAPPSKLPAAVKKIGETKRPKELLSFLRILFRDALLLKTQDKKTQTSIFLKMELSRVQTLAEHYSIPALLYAQECISDAEKQVKFNAVFPQCIEICMAKIRRKNAETQ